MKTLYLRNIKQGFATNSSSYHSTITRYIEIPKLIWVQFKEGITSENVDTNAGGYSSGISLRDDEDGNWKSYNEMEAVAEGGIEVRDMDSKNGEQWVRIIFDTYEEGDM